MGEDRKIVILGAGPAGLMCAWALVEKGYDVTLIEKETSCGGLCKTTDFSGFKFDLGGHRFISANSRLIQKVSSLLKEELLVRERKSVIRITNKVFSYPIRVPELILKLGLMPLLGIGVDFLLKKTLGKNKKKEVNSLEDWCIEKFGRVIYEKFFRPYNEKLWGISPALLLGEWADQRIPSLDISNFLKIFFRNKEHRTFSKQYLYPKNGIGEIFAYIEKLIVDKEGKIFTNSMIRRIDSAGNKIEGVEFAQKGKICSIKCDYLVSTVPLNEFVNLYPQKHDSAEIISISKQLKYRSLRFMNILLDMPKMSNSTWQYVPEEEIIFTRIQEPKNRSPYMAPVNKTSLMLEIPCNKGDTVWDMPDDELLERVVSDLKKINIRIDDDKIVSFFSTFAEYAYPIYTLDYNRNRKKLLDFFINKFENLLFCGRQGAFSYLFMDYAMMAGILASNYIIGEREYDRWKIANVMNTSELIESKSVTDTFSIH